MLSTIALISPSHPQLRCAVHIVSMILICCVCYWLLHLLFLWYSLYFYSKLKSVDPSSLEVLSEFQCMNSMAYANSISGQTGIGTSIDASSKDIILWLLLFLELLVMITCTDAASAIAKSKNLTPSHLVHIQILWTMISSKIGLPCRPLSAVTHDQAMVNLISF